MRNELAKLAGSLATTKKHRVVSNCSPELGLAELFFGMILTVQGTKWFHLWIAGRGEGGGSISAFGSAHRGLEHVARTFQGVQGSSYSLWACEKGLRSAAW